MTPSSPAAIPARSVRAKAPTRRRRLDLALAAGAVTAVGLVVATLGDGLAADLAGGFLYAALAYLVVALLAPRAEHRWVTVTAVVLCFAVELAQATGVPASLVEHWQPLRYLLGTTFNPLDLVAYTAGAGGAGLLDRHLSGRRLAGSARRPGSSRSG